MTTLQVLELTHELVVSGVGDLRCIERVVAIVGVGDLAAQLLDTQLRLLRLALLSRSLA